MKRQAQKNLKEQLSSFYKSCPEYFAIIKEEGKRSKLQELRLRQTVDLLQEGNVYLDVGCGAGVLINYAIQEKKVYAVGVELSHLGCQLARESGERTEGKASFVISDAEHLGVKSNSIDTVSTFETMEHLVYPRRALDEMIRCCKKGGLIILSIPHWFIGIHKRPDWILNFFKLPFFLLGMFFKFKLTGAFLVKPTPIFLNKEKWKGASAAKIADLDAVSWIWSESLYDYLEKNGCEVIEYDTYRYLKDALAPKKDSFLKRLKMRIFNLLSKTPFFKHLGTCVFIIARKENISG